MASKEINLILKNSLHAHVFNQEEQMYQESLERALDLISDQLTLIKSQDCKASALCKNEELFLAHNYHTIGVFGERGSGKTSFLISILNECQKGELGKDLEVLRMIDPTLVEHKKPIILCVIAMINQKIESYIKLKECTLSNEIYCKKRQWDKIVSKIAQGMFAIEQVGKGYDDALWQDETYVKNTGLNMVHNSNEFEISLREMIKVALDILCKKAFVFAFDDCDVDVSQGWAVLETLRRYLSDSRIISIVSGNISLYNSMVWNNVGKDVSGSNDDVSELMKHELSEQYMLKVLPPSYRIYLHSLCMSSYKISNILVKVDELDAVTVDADIRIVKRYRSILSDLGIVGYFAQKTFVEYLLSLPLRSQIHFLKDGINKAYSSLLDVFSAGLYHSGIDIEFIRINIQQIYLWTLKYLINNSYLPDSYLLLPSQSDNQLNNNFMALTVMACLSMKEEPFLIFDNLLRIGFIRNLVLPIEKKESIDSLCRYAGWYHLGSLKNNMGLTMAYAVGKALSDMKEHIPLYGLQSKAKKTGEEQQNAFDYVLRTVETNSLVKLLASFPFVSVTFTNKNESRNYYSLPALLAVIGELLKCKDETEMVERINDLKLFRRYQTPQEGVVVGKEEIEEGEDYGLEIDHEAIDSLAKIMIIWRDIYKQEYMLPPYVLGKIMTRFYSSLSKVAGDNVGERMNVMVANLYNACLIEEARVRCTAIEQAQLNNNNMVSNTDILLSNLNKQAIFSKLGFTRWMLLCPMLSCFLKKFRSSNLNIYSSIFKYKKVNHDFIWMENNVYEVLRYIQCKDRR